MLQLKAKHNSASLMKIEACIGILLLTLSYLTLITSTKLLAFGSQSVSNHAVVIAASLQSFARVVISCSLTISLSLIVSLWFFLLANHWCRLAIFALLLIGATPPPIWGTLAIMSLGLSAITPIITLMLSTFFILTAINISSFLGLPANVISIGLIYNVPLAKKIFMIILPEALPGLALGARLTFLVSWICLLSAEGLGSDQGVGTLLLVGRQLFDWKIVLSAWGIILALCSLTDCILLFLYEANPSEDYP